ncbi:hypothetical protein CYY_006237 [Polysphondylium violaceum]|uniref:DOCK family protein n=1 Tax=Polysphondylium violaceum TaxID=133409 RepID=A0A8J4PSH6_9MYCE|nr:hypothetical protein CYY_006237 [Polysphondylium violaceum]
MNPSSQNNGAPKPAVGKLPTQLWGGAPSGDQPKIVPNFKIAARKPAAAGATGGESATTTASAASTTTTNTNTPTTINKPVVPTSTPTPAPGTTPAPPGVAKLAPRGFLKPAPATGDATTSSSSTTTPTPTNGLKPSPLMKPRVVTDSPAAAVGSTSSATTPTSTPPLTGTVVRKVAPLGRPLAKPPTSNSSTPSSTSPALISPKSSSTPTPLSLEELSVSDDSKNTIVKSASRDNISSTGSSPLVKSVSRENISNSTNSSPLVKSISRDNISSTNSSPLVKSVSRENISSSSTNSSPIIKSESKETIHAITPDTSKTITQPTPNVTTPIIKQQQQQQQQQYEKRESSSVAKESTKNIKAAKKHLERVRVLSNRKGDFLTLNVQRNDILEIVEKGEKDEYQGSNGYKTSAFSISNTKTLFPLDNEPPTNTVKAIAVKDIKGNKNFTIIRGDLLCVLDGTSKKEQDVSVGRVKVGLDGWGELGDFPNTSIRLIGEEEYSLYSDLLDVIIEVSERLMDPDSFAINMPPNFTPKETEKEIERRQLVLRDRVKSIQLIREKILNASTDFSQLNISLKKEIELTRAFLNNEFYIINDSGLIIDTDMQSPLKLLKDHYSINGEKKSMKSDKLILVNSKDTTQADHHHHQTSASSRRQWEYGQIMIDVKLSRCTLPKKNYEFYFSLYNFTQSRYLTEQIMVPYDTTTSTNAPSFKFLFKNIEPADISEDICLVCKVVRKGTFKDIDEGQIKKGVNTDFRRPYGYACIGISVLDQTNERDSTLLFFSSDSDLNYSLLPDYLMKNNEEEIKKHVETIPPKATGPGAQVQQSGLPISLAFYDIPYDAFIQKNSLMGSLPVVEKLEHKVVFSESTHKFYLTLDYGKFTQGKKIEVCIRVRLDSGDFLPNCMSLGCSSSFVSELKSMVCYNTTSTVWNEFIHFSIPEGDFAKCHLLFTVRTCSSSGGNKEKNSIFAFAFLKLGNQDSTVLGNGDHNIVLYKTNSDIINVAHYIDISSSSNLIDNNGGAPTNALSNSGSGASGSSKDKDSSSKSTVRKNESLKVKSLLHSNRYIQHQSIIQLLNWKSHKEELPNLLDKFKFVEPIQIMRNLTKILDALFTIYDSTSMDDLAAGVGSKKSEPIGLMVYNTIVFIIGLLTDERTARFKQFKTQMDDYINNQFHFGNAHKHLLKCISYHLYDASHEDSAKISSTLKALEYIFQLITKSRLVYNKEKSTANEQDQGWKKELLDFLSMLNRLMSNVHPLLIVVKTMALRNYAVVMKGLNNFFTKQELCSILSEFIESVHYTEKQEHLNSYKLSVYYKILSTQLILDSETLLPLLPVLIATIDQHMTRGEELKLSTQLLALLLESIDQVSDQQTKLKCFNMTMIVFTKVMNLGESTLTALATEFQLGGASKNNNSTVTDPFVYDTTFLITSLFTMIQNLINLVNNNSTTLFEKLLLDMQPQENHIKMFIRKLFKIFDGFLEYGLFSPKWPTLLLFHQKTTLDAMNILSTYFYKHFKINNTTTNTVDVETWTLFLNIHFSFLISQPLRLNQNKINRLNYIQADLNQIRVRVLNSLLKAFDSLVQLNCQNQFYQTITEGLLYSLLNGNDDVNEFIQDLFYQLLKTEYNNTGGAKDKSSLSSFKKVESKTIEIIDKITIRERVCDEEIFKIFLNKRLIPSIDANASASDPFSKDARYFVSNITQLLSLLFDFRTLPTDRAFEEERTIATLKMMEYFKDRKDTYIKYLYELLNQHLTNNYFTEAGFAFLLHSDLYEWNEVVNVPLFNVLLQGQQQQISFPQETSSERKVRLIKMAIQYLDKGQVWEKCISLIQELKNHFEATYNFKSLSEILFQEAEFYEKILTIERFYCEYFRVGYYGKKFPVTIQGKEFLYRGFELERLSDFSARILAKFPNAELLKSTSEPTAEIQNSDGQYLLITIVTPSSIEEVQKKQKTFIKGTPANSINYLKKNDIKIFVYSKAFEKADAPKVSTNPNNKFGDLWIRNHFLYTDSSFPTIHRRAEVINKSFIELSPIENAINSVTSKNEELDEMVNKYEKNAQLNLNPLAMALNGIIDAAVNGGINLYREVFFDVPESKRPDQSFLSKLSLGIKKQAAIVEKGLVIFSSRCPEDLKGLNEKLESFFTKFKADMKILAANLDGTNRHKDLNTLPKLTSKVVKYFDIIKPSFFTLTETTATFGKKYLAPKISENYVLFSDKLTYDHIITGYDSDVYDFVGPYRYVSSYGKYQSFMIEDKKTKEKILYTSLHHPHKKNKKLARDLTLKHIEEQMKDFDIDHIVVGGDFNSESDDISDHFSALSLKPTFNGDVTTIKGSSIDNILISESIDVKEKKVHKQNSKLSHFPISATLSILD